MNCNCPLSPSTGPSLSSTCGGSTVILFLSVLEGFLRQQCDIEDPCNRFQPRETYNSEYDFVVIGGGTGGATVAGRLAEEGIYSVLLIEAGLEEPIGSQVPSFFYNYMGSGVDWGYKTESEKSACLNKNNQKCYWPRGKVLGGTSVMNGMMYMRGSPKDYDDWASLGNPGWSYQDVLPFFKRSEDNQQIDKVDHGYHSTGGPLPVSHFPYQPPMIRSIIAAGKELGYEDVDLNGKSHTGFSLAQTTTKNGYRFSSARAFLRPNRNRKNFHVLLNSTATRILFDYNKQAVGVEFFFNDLFHRVNIVKEVIISGGAVNSPQILLNSGVGPSTELNTVGVPLVHHLPGVGRNLHNHVGFGVSFTINETETNDLNFETAMQYLLKRDGLMSGTGLSQVTAMINTKYADPDGKNPDIQLIFSGYLAYCTQTGLINEAQGGRRSIGIYPTLLRPKSRGVLRLKNNDTLSHPLISPGYLTHPDDIKVLVEGIKFAIRLTKTAALAPYDFELEKKIVKGCEGFEFGTDRYWICAIMHNTASENHQAGSCKMGPEKDSLSVVDHQLRVRGVKGVRVADTSIMPQVTSGNTAAPAIMIGEKAADLIKHTWQ